MPAVFQGHRGQGNCAGRIFNDGVGWFQNFESMALKTVLRRLLSKWGELSVDDKSSQKIESMDEAIPSEFTRDNGFAEAKEVINVDAQTGEVVNDGAASAEAATAAEDDNPFK